MKIIVRGDHPIFARVDEVFDGPDSVERARERVNELIEYNYDNVYMEPVLNDKDLDKLAEKILPDVLRSNLKVVK